jgi:hypothetical protein
MRNLRLLRARRHADADSRPHRLAGEVSGDTMRYRSAASTTCAAEKVRAQHGVVVAELATAESQRGAQGWQVLKEALGTRD